MKHWIKKWSPLWTPFFVPDISLYSSCACYYIVLSAIPASLLFFALLSVMPNAPEYDAVIRLLLPSHLIPLVRPLESIKNQTPVGLLSLSGVIAAWSASKSIMIIRKGLNGAMESSTQESFIRKRIRAMALLLLLLLLFLLVSTVSIIGTRIFSQHNANNSSWIAAMMHWRLLYSAVIFSLMMICVYRFVPYYRLRIRYCILGGILSSLIYFLFLFAFSIYSSQISSYKRLYDILGITVLSMIWIRINIGFILYIGRFIFLIQSKNYHPITIIQSILSSNRRD